MNDSILDRIRAFLNEKGVAFTEKEHGPTFTSEESAAARGESLETGAKALLLKTDDDFRLFILPAHKKLDSGAIRKHLGVKGTRFATKEELLKLTGLVPGCIPPFGEPIFPFPAYADTHVGATGKVAFNAGSLTHSIIMGTAEWEKAARPERGTFAA